MPKRDELQDADGYRWDWVTLAVATVVAVVLALLTFEAWMSHGTSP